MTKFNYRVFLFICGILGISLQIVNYGWAMLWYYTILSNLLVTIFLAYTIYKSKKSSHFETTKYFRVKGGISLAISITFLVYHFLLAPLVTKEAYWNLENMLVHYIIPLGFLFDTLIFDKKNQYQKLDPLRWLGIQLSYTFIALFNGYITRVQIPGSTDGAFAYFFINIPKYGLGQVFLNTIVLFTLYVVLGYIFMLIKKYIGQSKGV